MWDIWNREGKKQRMKFQWKDDRIRTVSAFDIGTMEGKEALALYVMELLTASQWQGILGSPLLYDLPEPVYFRKVKSGIVLQIDQLELVLLTELKGKLTFQFPSDPDVVNARIRELPDFSRNLLLYQQVVCDWKRWKENLQSLSILSDEQLVTILEQVLILGSQQRFAFPSSCRFLHHPEYRYETWVLWFDQTFLGSCKKVPGEYRVLVNKDLRLLRMTISQAFGLPEQRLQYRKETAGQDDS